MPVLIKQGNRGQHVVEVQARLNLDPRVAFSPHLRLAEDGIFGPRTAQRVREWQTMKGLKVDGIVGPNTWHSLFSAGTSSAGASGAGAKPPDPGPPTPGALYVHAHDVPGRGQHGSMHSADHCHHIIVPAGKAAEAPKMMEETIDSNNLILDDMVLNTHGAGAGRIVIGGAVVNLQNQPAFFKAVKGRFASGAVLRIMACAFATAAVPLNDQEAWLVTPDELRYGDGIKALQVVARYLGIPVRAGFGMQFGDMSGYTGIWVSCQPGGEYRYHLLGRWLTAGEFLGMLDSMISAGPAQIKAQIQKLAQLKKWLVG